MSGTEVRKALQDFMEGLRLWRVWSYFAWLDVTAKYRRSILGPLWVSGGMVATSLALAIVFGAIFGNPLREILPYIMSGMLAWQLAALPITTGPDVFVSATGLIKSQRFPFWFHVFRHTARELIVFAHNIVIFFIMTALVRNFAVLHWQFIPALVLVPAFGAIYSCIIAMLAARYRDLRFMLPFLSQVIFFMTPVFWRSDAITDERSIIFEYNPLYYVVEILRNPLLGVSTPLSFWLNTILFIIVGAAIWLVTFALYRKRIPFWV